MTLISLYKIYESMFPGNSRVLDKHFFFLDKKVISDFSEQFQWNEAKQKPYLLKKKVVVLGVAVKKFSSSAKPS